MSRLFQCLGLGLSLAAVTASALFIAHHLLVLYASLAAEGLRPTAPLDVAGPWGLPASREADSSCVAPSSSRGDCRALSSETRPEQAALLVGLDALPIWPAALTPEDGALGRTGASRSVWTPYLPRGPATLQQFMRGNQGLRVDPEGTEFRTLKDAVADDQRALGEKRRRLVAQWLERAQGQFQSGRLTTPPGDNAFETYRMLLAVVPGQAEALAGLEQIAERCVQPAEAAREPGHMEASLALIDQGLQAVPGHARLAQLRNALGSGQAKAIGSTRRPGRAFPLSIPGVYTRPYRDASE